MDIQRTGVKEQRRRRQMIWGGVAAIVLVLLTIWVLRLEPAAPTVERSSVWVEAVQRGPMLRQVRGPGSLVPEEVRWISLSTEGVVEQIVLRPGVVVEPGSVILELTNPELEQRLESARLALAAGEADLINLRVRLESDYLTQTAEAARVEADYNEALLQKEANEALNKDGLISEIDVKRSRIRAEQLVRRVEIEKERLAKAVSSQKAQLDSKRAELDQARAVYQLRQQEVEGLKVRAGLAGVLQEVPVEVGQRVVSGTPLAKVAQPDRLKAELRIAETQAKDLQIGLPADIDTRNGIVKGKVVRIDPSVREGTVTVDVALEGALPPGARPDLSVDGVVEIERLADVLFVSRPTYAQANSTVSLFKLDADGEMARRTEVAVGKTSVDTIQILRGLEVGDQVILSEISQWESADRVRLK